MKRNRQTEDAMIGNTVNVRGTTIVPPAFLMGDNLRAHNQRLESKREALIQKVKEVFGKKCAKGLRKLIKKKEKGEGG